MAPVKKIGGHSERKALDHVERRQSPVHPFFRAALSSDVSGSHGATPPRFHGPQKAVARQFFSDARKSSRAGSTTDYVHWSSCVGASETHGPLKLRSSSFRDFRHRDAPGA